MSGMTRLPFMAGTLTVGAGIAALVAVPSLRHRLAESLGTTWSSTVFRVLVVAWALVNLKNVPFLWHFRVFKGLIYQLYFQPNDRTPRTLFMPTITSSYNTIYDSDYNLHKSNSTYFADLDVARSHYVMNLLRTSLKRLNVGDEEGIPAETRAVKGKYFVAVGAVACFFQREIAPLQRFEIYTRILSWDRKWNRILTVPPLYFVSHIVKAGAIKPDSYVLQPWRKSKKAAADRKKDEQDLKKHIFATSIARYVVKKGRLTVNPEVVIERSRLLPPRPPGVGLPPRGEYSGSLSATPAAIGTPAGASGSLTSPEKLATQVGAKLAGAVDADNGDDAADDGWTWDDMEYERLRGLEMASHFDKLSGLHDELRAGEVLGQYSDWF